MVLEMDMKETLWLLYILKDRGSQYYSTFVVNKWHDMVTRSMVQNQNEDLGIQKHVWSSYDVIFAYEQGNGSML